MSTHIDARILRDAFDLASEGRDLVLFGRVASVYKVMTPGQRGHRLSHAEVETMGYDVLRDGREGLKVRERAPDPQRVRFSADHETCIRMAYRFGTESMKRADGRAEFATVSNAYHLLVPDAPHGKKLRRLLADTGRWDFDEMRPAELRETLPGPEPMHPAPLPTAELPDDIPDDPADDGDDDRPYVPSLHEQLAWLASRRTTLMMRQRQVADWPREVACILPDGEERPAGRFGSLAGAWGWIRNLPAAVVAHGTRMTVTAVHDGSLDATATFDRDRGWLDQDGKPAPVVEFCHASSALRILPL